MNSEEFDLVCFLCASFPLELGNRKAESFIIIYNAQFCYTVREGERGEEKRGAEFRCKKSC